MKVNQVTWSKCSRGNQVFPPKTELIFPNVQTKIIPFENLSLHEELLDPSNTTFFPTQKEKPPSLKKDISGQLPAIFSRRKKQKREKFDPLISDPIKQFSQTIYACDETEKLVRILCMVE